MGAVGGNLSTAAGGDLRLIPPAPARATLAELKASLEPIAINGVARAIRTANPPELTESVWHYFREIGGIFVGMSTNGNYTPEFLTNSADRVPAPLTYDSRVVDVKLMLIALYKLAYADRTAAEVSPTEWLSKVAELFTASIDQGLKRSGRQGLR